MMQHMSSIFDVLAPLIVGKFIRISILSCLKFVALDDEKSVRQGLLALLGAVLPHVEEVLFAHLLLIVSLTDNLLL